MDTAPLFALRLRTPRLELRLPTREELRELFRVAEAGIYPPGEEIPFAVAWTDDLQEERFVAFHEAALADWSVDRWDCNFVTFLDGRPIGSQTLHGHGFPATRTAGSGSWLGLPYHGRGLGTEQRAAVLELAFSGLGAAAATTGALAHNLPSQRVSEKLGYRLIGDDTVSPRGKPLRHLNYRLERDRWRPPVPVALDALEACLPLFGAV